MNDVQVDLKLTFQQVNAVLLLVSRGAYAEVADLIAEIRRQVQPQFEAAQAAQAAASVEVIDPPAQ